MNKLAKITIIFLIFFSLTALTVHKFYVSIYQINYVSQKKMIQITSRIFIDDMNDALGKKFHKKTYVGTDRETEDDVVLMKKYLAEKFVLKLNGTSKPMNFLSKEIEANVIVSYFSIKDVFKISSLSIENSALLEVNEEQQNIIQANISGEKESLLLTSDNFKGVLK